MFTYPKAATVFGLATFVSLGVVCVNEFERIEHFNTSFSDTIHSNDNMVLREIKQFLFMMVN